jgi:hypothetical protein
MPASSFATEIAVASAMVRKFCNRQFDSGNYTEIHDAGPRKLFLAEYPVTSVTSLTLVDDASNTELVATTDYRIDLAAGILRFESRPWEKWRNVEITYVGGYATIPAELDFATAVIAAALWQQAQTPGALVGMKSEKLGAYAYELMPNRDQGIGPDGLPYTAKAILMQYRRTII